MNVALTRAKSSCFVVGDAAKLATDPTWSALICDAKARGVLIPVSIHHMMLVLWPNLKLPRAVSPLLLERGPALPLAVVVVVSRRTSREARSAGGRRSRG